MTPPPVGRCLTLGVFPNSRGFGWAAFDGPFSVIEFGHFTVLRNKHAACLDRADRLFARLKPKVVVLEAFDRTDSKRSERIRRLCLSIAMLVAGRGHEFRVYKRSEVQAAFASVGALTREEIARAIARSVPTLAHRLPPKRRFGDGEDKRLSIFNAAALVLAHFHSGCTDLFNDLKDAA